MPSFSVMSPSKSKTKTKIKEGQGDNTTKSPMRKLSVKLAQKVKRQLWRLDEVLHHVTHTQHDPDATPAPRRARTQSLPSSHFFRAVIPTSSRSSSSRDTWDNKHTKGRQSFDRETSASDDHHDLPVAAPLYAEIMPEKCYSAPASVPRQDGEVIFPPAGLSAPAPVVGETTDDLRLIKEDPEEPSEEQEEVGLSPIHVPCDHMPLLVPPSTAQSSEPSLNNIAESSCEAGSSLLSEHIEVDRPVQQLALIMPTKMASPLPNMRHPFYTNMLTWWLCRNIVYRPCTVTTN